MVDLGGGPAPTPFSARISARLLAPVSARRSLLTQRVLEATNVTVFRLSKGRWHATVLGAPVVLLSTSGHKTGARHTHALLALEDGMTWVVAGAPERISRDSSWYENLVAYEESQRPKTGRSANAPVLIAPEVELAGNRRVAVRSDRLTGDAHAKWWAQMLEVAPRLDPPGIRTPQPATPVVRLTPLGC